MFSNPRFDNVSAKTLNNRKSELVLKTMYKSNGDYKNNKAYKEFSSTSLNANAKVPHRSSSHGGAEKNNT
ncbi:DUF3519 domain-containing protein [Helicobacter pylori]|nr:DUF3519 domain-containing protein [Helicobacter pylori]